MGIVKEYEQELKRPEHLENKLELLIKESEKQKGKIDSYLTNNVKKEKLEYTLKIIARVFENSAEKSHIEEFKEKYRGVPWSGGIERSLLTYARTRSVMARWIENLVDFMVEKNLV